ncbi:MAG: hypothetical protein ABI603_03515, partial [Acidobacteriota bacterium]
ISGPGTFAGNGNLQSAFSGSHVEVTIKGGNAITYSNFEMIIGPPAASHYGTETFHGVVTEQRPMDADRPDSRSDDQQTPHR